MEPGLMRYELVDEAIRDKIQAVIIDEQKWVKVKDVRKAESEIGFVEE